MSFTVCQGTLLKKLRRKNCKCFFDDTCSKRSIINAFRIPAYRYARNWRYHKELGLWLTKEPDENGRPVVFRRTSPNAYERDVYVFFDPSTWQKIKREYTLLWDSIEDRSQQMQAMGLSNTSISPGVSNRGVMI